MRSDFDLTDLEARGARRDFSRTKRGGMPQLTREPLPMRTAAAPGLEMEPVDEAATAGAQPSATTMNEVATSSRIIHYSGIQGSNNAHNTINNSLPNVSSNIGDTRSRSSGEIRSISSTIPGPAG